MECLGWSEGVELVSGCLWVLWFCLEGGDVGLEVVVWFVVEGVAGVGLMVKKKVSLVCGYGGGWLRRRK